MAAQSLQLTGVLVKLLYRAIVYLTAAMRDRATLRPETQEVCTAR